jgi:hypothetical protein
VAALRRESSRAVSRWSSEVSSAKSTSMLFGRRDRQCARGPHPGSLCRRSSCRTQASDPGCWCFGHGLRAPRVGASDGWGGAGGRGWRASERDRQRLTGACHHGARRRSCGNRSYRFWLCRRGWLSSKGCLPNASRPTVLCQGGGLNQYQGAGADPSSVRSCLAPASGCG